MKKLIAAMLMATLVFSPVGNTVFHDQTTIVEAKSYKSGKKRFNNNNNTTNNNNSFFQNKKNDTTNPTTKNKGIFSGGLMKTLALGGLAGFLFGTLFASMGMLGSILGLIVNILGVILLIGIIRKVLRYFADKKKKEDPNPWRG